MNCYLVGGAVRDRLLGYPSSERDWVVVGATPQQMLDAGFKPVGRDFPVFIHPQTGEEYALARTERKSGHGYHGFTFHADPSVTLEQDLARRDLTINAIAEAADGTLVDPFGGRQDLQCRQLRHVSPAFAEDPLRILRLARFAARYHHLGFSVAKETRLLVETMVTSGEVDHLVPERIWKETERSLGERHPQIYFAMLQQCGALTRLTNGNWRRGGDNWHALQLAAARDFSIPVRFSVLFTTDEAEQAGAVCDHWKVPRVYSELARLSITASPHANAAGCADEAFALLQQSDALRRPERFGRFLQSCAARGVEEFKLARLGRALARALAVTADTLATTGLRGPELGAALMQARREAVTSAWL